MCRSPEILRISPREAREKCLGSADESLCNLDRGKTRRIRTPRLAPRHLQVRSSCSSIQQTRIPSMELEDRLSKFRTLRTKKTTQSRMLATLQTQGLQCSGIEIGASAARERLNRRFPHRATHLERRDPMST